MKVSTAMVGMAALLFAASSLAQDTVETTKAAPAVKEAPKPDRGAIKIPLAEDESAELRLNFDYRARFQVRRPASYAAGANNDDTDSGVLSRLRIGADLALPGNHGFKMVLQDARSFGSEPRGAVNTGNNDLSFLEAYWRMDDLLGKGVKTRLGRQQWQWGSGRILGLPEFSNTSRAFDGVKLMRDGETYSASAFLAIVSDGLRASDDEYLGGVTVDFTGNRAFTFGAMMLYELRQEPVGAADAASRFTWNPRAHGYFGDDVEFQFPGNKPRGQIGYEVEFALQHGEETEQERSVLASAFALRLEYNHKIDDNTAITVEAGYDFASGDSNLADTKNRTFKSPYSSGHAFHGHADLLGWSNLNDYWASIRYYNAESNWSGYFAVHHFRRASSGDGMYGTNGAMVRAGGANRSREIGTEVDISVLYQINNWMSLEVAYSHLFKGQFIKDSASALPSDGSSYQGDSDVIWASLQIKF